MEISEEVFKVNGIALHVWTCGPESGPVLLLLHGFPEAGFAWKAQLHAFALQGFRVLAPDQRGYNRSSKPQTIKDYRIENLVEDMVALIQAASKEKVAVAGHDWGGAVAWHLALTHPQLLRCLIILNMPHPQVMRQTLKNSGRQRLKSSYGGFFQLPFLPEWLGRAFNYRLLVRTLRRTSLPGTFTHEALARYREAWRQPGALRGMINWYRAYRFSKPLAQTKVVVPVLLIWGKKDAFLLPQMAAASAAHCADVQLVALEEATHWLHHEVPAQINGLIQSFLASRC